MPGPITHLASAVPLTLGYKWLNLLTLFIAVGFPDVMPMFFWPLLVGVLNLRGPSLNRVFTFFDQSILGGLISASILIVSVLLFIRFCPKLSKPFKYKQNYSAKAIILSGILGALLHVLFDNFA